MTKRRSKGAVRISNRAHRMLFSSGDSLEGYERAVRDRFGYMGNGLKALFHNEFGGIPAEPFGILRGVLSFEAKVGKAEIFQ
jgi:hypothetical protein